MTDTKQPEIIDPIEAPKPGRRRRYSTEQKLSILDEAEQPGETLSGVARRHGISPSLVFRWRQQRDEGAFSAVAAGESVVPASEMKKLQAKVRELERMLGKKTMEAEILREAVEVAREKKWIARAPLMPKDDGR